MLATSCYVVFSLALFFLILDTTVTGENTNKLTISGLEPAASKNYTCTPATGEIGLRINHSSYTYHVIGECIHAVGIHIAVNRNSSKIYINFLSTKLLIDADDSQI